MSVADEIKKYKELFDMGAITEQEYEEKKKKILFGNQSDEKKQQPIESNINESIENEAIKNSKLNTSNKINSTDKEPNRAGLILRYIFGFICIFTGIVENPIYILLGLSLLPVIYTLLQRYNKKISSKKIKDLAIILPVAFLFLAGILVDPTYIRDSKIDLGVGQIYNIEFVKEPDNYYLTSTDENIVSIENNVITAHNEGNAKIQLFVDDKAKKTIKVDVKYLELNDFSLSLNNTYDNNSINNIDIKYIPENASNKEITITSSDDSIVSIEEGQLISKSLGECVITATSYNNIVKEYYVTVIEPVTELNLNIATCDLYSGDTKKITASIKPKDATNQEIIWSSSDNSVATIDDGNVTALSMGTTTITATSHNGISAICTVNVKEKAPISINNFKYTIDYVGGVEWTFSITNNTEKVINYVNLKWSCYNAVGDPIYDQISGDNEVGLQYTGPLAPHKNSGTKRNMTRFYNSNYSKANLNYIEIIYEDGTNKIIKGNDIGNYEGLIK